MPEGGEAGSALGGLAGTARAVKKPIMTQGCVAGGLFQDGNVPCHDNGERDYAYVNIRCRARDLFLLVGRQPELYSTQTLPNTL